MNRDERAARRWAKRMDHDPEAHRAGLMRWVDGRPERLARYNDIQRALGGAKAAGRLISMDSVLEAKAAQAPLLASPPARVLALAAALVMMCGLVAMGIASLRWIGAGFSTQTSLASSNSYHTRVGEVRKVILPDGSMVILDTDTELALHFTDTERRLELIRGRARFDVAHDKVHPFVVYAAGGSVTATGTLFDVTSRDGFKVALLRGGVDVRLPGGAQTHGRDALHLAPGQMVALLRDQGKLPPEPTPTKPSDLQWVSGMKTFDDVPIRDIISEANSYAADKIVLADPALGEHEAFIDLDIRNTALVAQKLATYLHLIVDRSQTGKIILRTAE